MRYHQHIDGDDEWVRLKSAKGFRIRCCDCRLVHVLDFRLVKLGRGHRIEFRAKRDDQATAKARKRRGVTVGSKSPQPAPKGEQKAGGRLTSAPAPPPRGKR